MYGWALWALPAANLIARVSFDGSGSAGIRSGWHRVVKWKQCGTAAFAVFSYQVPDNTPNIARSV